MRSHHPTSSLLQSAKASAVPLLILRTTVPLASYIRNSLRFWYYASLSTCCQNLEKIAITGKILGESGCQTFKGADREKCQFQYSGNFQHQVFAIFGEEDQQPKLVRSLKKKS